MLQADNEECHSVFNTAFNFAIYTRKRCREFSEMSINHLEKICHIALAMFQHSFLFQQARSINLHWICIRTGARARVEVRISQTFLKFLMRYEIVGKF